MKKCLVFIVLIFSLFCFVGCDKKDNIEIQKNYIMIATRTSREGEVVQEISYGINLPLIKSLSKNKEEEISFISTLTTKLKKLRENYLFKFALKYLENPVDEYKINKGVKLTEAVYSSNTDSIGFKIIFSKGAFSYYNKSQNESEKETKKNLYINKDESNSTFIFSEEDSEYGNVGERFKQDYLSSAKGLSFEEELKNKYNPDFIYGYVTPYSQIKSNCNYFTKYNDDFYHFWVVKNNFLINKNTIKIWVLQINYGFWYITILASVLIPLFIGLIIHFIINKKYNFFN